MPRGNPGELNGPDHNLIFTVIRTFCRGGADDQISRTTAIRSARFLRRSFATANRHNHPPPHTRPPTKIITVNIAGSSPPYHPSPPLRRNNTPVSGEIRTPRSCPGHGFFFFFSVSSTACRPRMWKEMVHSLPVKLQIRQKAPIKEPFVRKTLFRPNEKSAKSLSSTRVGPDTLLTR